jgi:hypothetical protein
MRVVYAVVSGGCALSTSPGQPASGVVSSSFTFNEVRQACVLSFTAYFGAGSGTVSATSADLASQTRRVVASSVVFDAVLAAGPLVAGASNTFKRESPCFRDIGAASSSACGCLCAALRGCNVFRI